MKNIKYKKNYKLLSYEKLKFEIAALEFCSLVTVNVALTKLVVASLDYTNRTIPKPGTG